MRQRSYLIGLIFLFLPLTTHAGKSYNLPQLVELALDTRPEMKIAEGGIAESENQLKEAKSYYYPQLDLNAAYTHLNEKPYVVVPRTTVNADVDLSQIKSDYPILAAVPDSITVPITIPPTTVDIAGQDSFKIKTELKQPLFTGGKIKERVKQARYMMDITGSQKGRSAQEIVMQVRSLYFQLVFAQRALSAVKAAEERLKVVASFLDNLYRNYIPKEGQEGVTKSDYLKARLSLSKIREHESDIQRIKDEAKKSLMIACNLKDYDFTVSNEAEKYAPKHPSQDLEELKALAVANRPELEQLGLAQKISESEIKRVKAGYYPDLGLFGSYQHTEDNFSGTQKDAWAAGAMASVPIFNGMRTSSEVKKARASYQKVGAQRELMELKISMEIEVLHNKLADCLRKINIENEALTQARERRQLESEAYMLDAKNYDDYLEALEDEINTEISLLKTKAEHYVTLAQLQLALGQ
jgi:outer membrane protein TolC